ncbi:MAG: SAM-dependent methyltransferase [Myxococcota bacterium]
MAARRRWPRRTSCWRTGWCPRPCWRWCRASCGSRGKARRRAALAQAELDADAIEAVRAGRDVVRLKCGDPFLLGRGGEEIVAYRAAGIEAEVVPGVSAALAGPLLAGIPATMRGHADRVLVATASLGGDGRWRGCRRSTPTRRWCC